MIDVPRSADTCDPSLRLVIESDHPELDDLVRGLVEARRLGIEQNAGPDLWPMVGTYVGRATRRRSTR